MIKPTIEEVTFSADTESLFARFRHLPGAVWLDSGKPRSLQGRFDIISALPAVQLKTSTGNTEVMSASANRQDQTDDPFSIAWEQLALQGLIGKDFAHIPFCGGLIGYFTYDLGEQQMAIGRIDTPLLPKMHVGWYGWGLITNHQSSKCWLVIHPQCKRETIQLVKDLLARPAQQTTGSGFKLASHFVSDTSEQDYLSAIAMIKNYIEAGDCYQINYAVKHSANYEGDLWEAYQRLRKISPSPYGAFLRWDDRDILCFSPERFLKVSVGKIEAKPIKGTFPRGKTLEEDQDYAVQLLNSKKDRAENLMIVDLLRNDLGKNSVTGSVRVPKLFALESFANVHHLVSTITGDLAANKTPLDLLRDAFPGGSITGAPKRRAMEIIAALERVTRGIYCGSIGYISANGRMDTNIAIRTLEASNGKLSCWGGGGIVADSDPAQEYREALHKVDNLIHALEMFR